MGVLGLCPHLQTRAMLTGEHVPISSTYQEPKSVARVHFYSTYPHLRTHTHMYTYVYLQAPMKICTGIYP